MPKNEKVNSIEKEKLEDENNWKPVYSRDFYCEGPPDGEHPRVFYTFADKSSVRCGYCNTKYIYAEADI
tara:strand:+ start:1195 stop:1401 length:207 start_codon:yes stop_codon:yes gene_type:complete